MQFYSRRKKILTINIVTLIDILSILIIFFIVTTTFKKTEPEVEIDLPESTTAEKIPQEESQEPLIIYATKDEEIFVGEQKIEIEKLTAYLERKKSEMKEALFALKADKEAPVGLFVKILDSSKEAGIGNLSMYTAETEETTKPNP
ncbi:MAG: biopolymer transporter ExbD [Verrucomicrobiota bacterium]